jgi:hypothetical protein
MRLDRLFGGDALAMPAPTRPALARHLPGQWNLPPEQAFFKLAN